MSKRTAATRLLPQIHDQLSERAAAAGITLSEYLEQLVLKDLEERTSAQENANGVHAHADLASVLELLRTQREDLLRLGQLVFLTRSSFFNFALVYTQVMAGEIEPKKFDWKSWAEDKLVSKRSIHGDGGKPPGN